MSRLRFKGGAWTNSEDEVLRASLAVYGLHNWERVASMLVRKTAPQCRERWEAYLDPRLHLKEAWTSEEEETLVRLQALFPNQWNLTAKELRHRCGMNRPAWLCEEHYHSLLDALEYEKQRGSNNNNKKNDTLTLEDFLEERKRHRGVHQGYETRAARPDSVNSEVFEKEMVEFAVSRLANQDGKKGLRKERKKQLEHTSFLAKLQNNRESIESGTLSANAKKRMERAMLEDLAGPSDTRLQDNTIEDNEDEDYEENNDNNEVKKRRRGEFKPIDLGADKEAAGIQAKQRVLVKNLSPGKTSHVSDSLTSEVVNLDLLRLASGTSTTTTTTKKRRLEGKKEIKLLEDKKSSDIQKNSNIGIPSNSVDNTDLDSLFASLPDVMSSKNDISIQDNGIISDDLFNNLPPPETTNNKKIEEVYIPSLSYGDFSRDDDDDDDDDHSFSKELTLESSSSSLSLDFNAPSGSIWLQKAKKRVSIEAERAFLSRKSLRQSSLNRKHHNSLLSTEHTDKLLELEKNKENKPIEKEEQEEEKEDAEIKRVIKVLVENQMKSTTKYLINKNSLLNEKNSKNRNEKNKKDLEIVNEKLNEENVSNKLTECVSTVHQENGGEIWKDVSAIEATVQLEDLLNHQREHVSNVTLKAEDARKKISRIVKICFMGKSPYLCKIKNNNNNNNNNEIIIRHACSYWGTLLQDEQKKLAFYSAIREVERQEMQKRIDEATQRLVEIEAKEKTLQELYRVTFLKRKQEHTNNNNNSTSSSRARAQ